MKLPELKYILKKNGIKGYSHYNKKDLTEFLVSEHLIEKPEERLLKEKSIKDIGYLKHIRHTPKRVNVVHLESGLITEYPSIYKCASAFKLNPGIITYYTKHQKNIKIDGALYEIKVID